MYRGFKLNDFTSNDQYYALGLEKFNSQKKGIQKRLKDFMYSDNSIDGTSMQADWFPQIEADIFISHSHKDQKMAICLAGWLWSEFNLNCFIDSLIWGYANDLLKEIDEEFCKNLDGNTYNYHSRNFSTSHVHMMLSTALAMMIDKTECLIFLDTPHSIKPIDSIENTQSPWIYFEIATSKIIQKRTPKRLLLESRSFSDKLTKSLSVNYILDLDHLPVLEVSTLKDWSFESENSSEHPLDVLYNVVPSKRRTDIIQG